MAAIRKRYANLMATLSQSGRFALSVHALSAIRTAFSADRADEEETAASMRTMLRETGHFIDPHTAVGVTVSEKEMRDPQSRWWCLERRTQPSSRMRSRLHADCVLPFRNGWLISKSDPNGSAPLPADQLAVEKLILSRSRAVQAGAAT